MISRRVAVLVAALLPAACAGSPLSPSDSVTGTWSGRFEQLDCTTTAIDPRTCGHNRVGDVQLTLAGNGGSIIGEVVFRSDQTGALVVSTLANGPLPVTGSFSAPELVLNASHIASQPNGGTYIATLSDWRTTLTGSSVFDGVTTWTQTTASKFGTSTSVRMYRLTGLRRGAR